MGYIDVPASPLNGWAVTSTHVCPPSPFSISEGRVAEGSSLVQYKSITVTPKDSSEIAKDALLKLDNSDPEYRNCFEFVDYLDKCESKGFTIKGYETRKGKLLNLPMSYNNRWGPVRRRELSEKLKRLEFWFEFQEDRPVTLVTLTSYHEGLSISSAWFELNKSRDKLRKLIHKYFGNVDYFWVVEPHKSGYAHYHMAVFADVDNNTKDKKGRGIEDKFRDLWSKKYKTGNHTYGLDFAQKKDESKIKHLKNYLQKYLSKGFLLDKWTPGMLKFNAAMHDTGFRMYGASKNIRDIMNCDTEKPSQVVWLETKMQYPESVNGEVLELEKVIWYRQYIPDWLDSDFWLYRDGMVRQEDPPPIYIFDWGRLCSFHAQETKVMDMSHYVSKRKREVDPYEQFNKEYAGRNRKI